MIKAKYIVPGFSSKAEYKEWVEACGLIFERLDPASGGNFELYVTGDKQALNQFSAELDYGPAHAA
jgi:hypothetical protein